MYLDIPFRMYLCGEEMAIWTKAELVATTELNHTNTLRDIGGLCVGVEKRVGCISCCVSVSVCEWWSLYACWTREACGRAAGWFAMLLERNGGNSYYRIQKQNTAEETSIDHCTGENSGRGSRIYSSPSLQLLPLCTVRDWNPETTEICCFHRFRNAYLSTGPH